MAQAVVGHDQLVAVVPPGHPWASKRSVEMRELAETPLVMREQGSGTREALEQALADAGHGQPVSVLELGSTSAVRSAVVSGNSPTVISRLAVVNEIAEGQLVEVRIKSLKIERDLRAVWPNGKPLPKLAIALLADLT
jgi:DNA-binding transcriptional LysR family regulator